MENTRLDGIAAALDGATYVQESIVESLDAKRALYAELDALDGGLGHGGCSRRNRVQAPGRGRT